MEQAVTVCPGLMDRAAAFNSQRILDRIIFLAPKTFFKKDVAKLIGICFSCIHSQCIFNRSERSLKKLFGTFLAVAFAPHLAKPLGSGKIHTHASVGSQSVYGDFM